MVFFPKSLPAPQSLEFEKSKTSGTYRTQDVIWRLYNDFCNKCYICEIQGTTGLNVEHFIPHRGNRDLEFSWENLFLACSHCNKTKGSRFDKILNCTKQEDRVDRAIRYVCYLGLGEGEEFAEKAEFEVIDKEERVEESVKLLYECFNGRSPLSKIESANLRKALLEEMNCFQKVLLQYSDDKREDTMEQIKYHLSRKSPFTAFKRWVIWDNPSLSREFGGLIED